MTAALSEILNPWYGILNDRMAMTMPRYKAWVVWFFLGFLLCGFPTLAQQQQLPSVSGVKSRPPDAQGPEVSVGGQLSDPRLPGSISGTVVDQSGAAVRGAAVTLSREDQSPGQEVLSGDDGQFSFANIAPGPFQLTITSAGFTMQTSSGILSSGEIRTVPQIALAVAATTTEVRVVPSLTEVAEDQIKVEEKQRVLGVVPNFYVTYVHNAAPLNSRQKFELALKTMADPISFGVNGAVAGVQQAANEFSGYGQGAQGYAKRYAASYGDLVFSTLIGSALLPSLLKQDPRYFYKGNGGKRSRLLYAIANSVICKGDDGHWQANYSSILGSLAAGGISNLYYPAKDRNGAGLTFENTLIGIGQTAAINLLQEFLLPKLSSNVPRQPSSTP